MISGPAVVALLWLLSIVRAFSPHSVINTRDSDVEKLAEELSENVSSYGGICLHHKTKICKHLR